MKTARRTEPATDATSRARADAMIAWLRDYGARRLDSRLMDERRSIAPHVVIDFGNHGLLGLLVEERYGGAALRYRDIARVVAQTAALDLGLGTWLTTTMGVGVRSIAAFGSTALKEEFLPALASGRVVGAYASTEPGAGSDFMGQTTRARRVAGGYRLSGEKVWTGNGSWGGVITIFGKLGAPDDEMPAAFAMRADSPGVVVGPDLLSMGARGMVQCRMSFRDVALTDEQLLGEGEEGMLVNVDSTSHARFNIAAKTLGGLMRVAQLMHRFADRRRVASGRLLDDPTVLATLGEVAAAIALHEALIEALAAPLDRGEGLPVEPFVVAKILGPELLFAATDRLMQLCGSRGYDEANPVAQLFRDARAIRIFEGPTETMRSFLGQRALHRSPGTTPFIERELGDSTTARRVADAVAAIAGREWPDRPPLASPSVARSWRAALAGELVARGFALALLRRREGGTRHAARAVAWAEQRLDEAIAQSARAASLEAAMLGPEDAAALVAGYVETIGDVEQNAPGESRGLDPLLRREVPA